MDAEEAEGERSVAAENTPPPAPKYEPTSCRCRAQEGERHSGWCDLAPFPAGLPITRAETDELNARYAEFYGYYVEGEALPVLAHGDFRVFPCSCGCGARVAVTGMLWALRPSNTWWIHDHAPLGVIHRGRRYNERAAG